AHRHRIDFVFGWAGKPVLLRHAAPVMQEARRLPQQRTARAPAHHARPPDSSRLYAELAYGAASWAQPWRVLLPAEVLASGCQRRFVVTSLVAHPRSASMRTSTVRAVIVKTISRRSSVLSTATAPPHRPSSPTPGGFCWRVPPLSCIMPSALRRSHRPRWPKPNPRP